MYGCYSDRTGGVRARSGEVGGLNFATQASPPPTSEESRSLTTWQTTSLHETVRTGNLASYRTLHHPTARAQWAPDSEIVKNALANQSPRKPRQEVGFLSHNLNRLSQAQHGQTRMNVPGTGTISPSGSAELREAIQTLSRPGVDFCIGQDFGSGSFS